MSAPTEDSKAFSASTEEQSAAANNPSLDHTPTDTSTPPTTVDQELAGAMASEAKGASASRSDLTNDAPGLERLFQRMKSEVMFELRHLQHGERPVTGQGHRDSLHQFMLKHCEEGRGENHRPANVDAVEEHRPEAVVVEVQGVIERRPVSSVLQSAAFRRQLENVIRGGLVNASRSSRREPAAAGRRGTPPPPRQQARQTVAASAAASIFAAASAGNSRSTVVAEDTPNRVAATDRRPLSRSESTESIDSFSSARSSNDQDLEDFEVVNEINVSQAGAAIPEHIPPVTHHESPAMPRPRPRSTLVNQNSPSTQQDNQNDSGADISWGDISRIHREEMVQEISELLHRRLVTSTLQSEFRATMEVLAESHVQASGHDGQAVQDFVRRLPGQGIPHNDFSNLGIPADGAGFNLNGFEIDEDNVSIASSPSVVSVPYVQTNTYLGREVQSLRKQVMEMKSMLKLSFGLQMDIQRSIRQEVAAALNSHAGPTDGATAAAPASSRPVSDTHCLICLDKRVDTVLYQCGHMCVCYMCGRDLVSRGHSCPVCRAPIKDVIRAYKTNAE